MQYVGPDNGRTHERYNRAKHRVLAILDAFNRTRASSVLGYHLQIFENHTDILVGITINNGTRYRFQDELTNLYFLGIFTSTISANGKVEHQWIACFRLKTSRTASSQYRETLKRCDAFYSELKYWPRVRSRGIWAMRRIKLNL